MSRQPTIAELQADNERLRAENLLLRQRQDIDLSEITKRWQQLINHKDCSPEVLEEILSELANRLHVKSANLLILNKATSAFEMAARFPPTAPETIKSTSFQLTDYQHISDTLFSGHNVIISDLSDLPDSSSDKASFKAYHQQSALFIPIMHQGALQASVDLHDDDPKKWSDTDIALTNIAATLLYQGYQKHLNRLFQNWLENSEQQLTHATDLNALESCLYEFCRLLNIEGINFFVPAIKNPAKIETVCQYPPSDDSGFGKFYTDTNHFPWTTQQFLQGKLVAIDDFSQLPEDATTDRETLNKLQHLSTLIVPLLHSNKISGLLALYTTEKKHHWTQREIQYTKKILPLLYAVYQQLQHHKARQESTNTLELVLKTTSVGYCILNRDLSDCFYSSFAHSMLGYPKDQEITTDWVFNQLLWSKEDRENEAKWRETTFQRKPTNTGILKLRSANNSPVWTSCNYSPYSYKENGDINSVLVGLVNISSIIEKQEALEKARIEADTANAEKSDFLARMSHEIRTPMNAILGMAHLIQDTDLNEKQQEQITHIDQAAQNLLGIINDILDFSKIESGKLELECTDFELPALLEQVTQVASYHSRNHEQELILEIDENTPSYLKGDPLRLRQVLTNLLSNSIKFTKKGNIYLKVKPTDNDGIRFTIIDQGIGMNETQLSHLFQPFTQADGSISRQYGGTGLGLSIVKRLIELMGSHIEVYSKPDKGSYFSFTIKLKETNKPVKKHINFNHIRTLVVDDNKEAREVICSIARQLNLQVYEADSAEKALTMLRHHHETLQQHFELVLMDYRMPEIDGLHAAEIIKQDKKLKYLPTIIMVSACDRDEVMKNSLSQYLEGFLSKPVSPSRLYNSVNHLLFDHNEAIHKETICDSRLKDLRVLLVEDNIVNQKVAKGILSKQGVITTTVNNGQEAIDALMNKNNNFELVLMDIEMPIIDGYQATSFIRNNLNLSIPIIAMTAHAMDSARDKCLEVGMNAHIHKPIEPKLFYKTISSCLAPKPIDQ